MTTAPLKYKTSHCPKCNAIRLVATGNITYGSSYQSMNEWIVNHPTCNCEVFYKDFTNESPVPNSCLVVWREVAL